MGMSRRVKVVFLVLSTFLLMLYLGLLAKRAPTIVVQPAFVRDPVQKAGHPKKLATEKQVKRHKPETPTPPIPQEKQRGFQKRLPIPREGPEIRQVVFSKVHKAASSTMQNIFFRFALARNLNVLLKKKRVTSIGESSRLIRNGSVVPLPEGKRFYDILCSHVIYDEEQISKYFLKTAVRIAIVREPVKQALSALKYYLGFWDPTHALARGFQRYKDDLINNFLRHPQHFYDNSKGPSHSYINNRMSVDLGFDLEAFEASKKNTTKIQTFLQQVQSEFDLVLVSDYFDESLVLMRRTLRWSLKDIVYLSVNIGEKRKKPILKSTTIQSFRIWDEIDFQLYDHFLKIFLLKIKNEPLFQDELSVFRSIQKDVKNFCVIDKSAKSLQVPKSAWTKKFIISRSECKLMSTGEIHLTDIVRNRQKSRNKSNI